MDIRMDYNGVSITNHVIGYDRSQQLCTGVGSLSVTLKGDCSITFAPYGELVLYEGAVKVGTYYLNRYDKSESDYTILLDAADASKKLKDYFIAESYEVTGFEENTKYWIRKFCDEMGITISYDRAGDGHPISNNTTIGMMSAYDQILELCQMSGWYFWFDAENVIHIGTTRRKINSYEYLFDSSNTLEVSIDTDDKMLRNRAVVWGNGDPSGGGWIFSDISIDVPWQYDKNDKRAVVISNSNIKTDQAAFDLAMKALKEFGKITDVKTIVTPGYHEIYLGELCRVKTVAVNSIGFVTSIASSMSSNGLITTVTLDERCPRLFGYFSLGDYVYVSTMGSGVWRKHIDHDLDWVNVSYGIEDPSVTDLYKRDDLMSCVTGSGLAYYSHNIPSGVEPGKIPSGVENSVLWKEIEFIGSIDTDLLPASGVSNFSKKFKARAVCQDIGSNAVKLVADSFPANNNARFDYGRGLDYKVGSGSATPSSWIVEYNSSTNKVVSTTPIITGEDKIPIRVLDIENDGRSDYAVICTMSGTDIGMGEGIEWDAFDFVSVEDLRYGEYVADKFIDGFFIYTDTNLLNTYDAPFDRGITMVNLDFGNKTLSSTFFTDESLTTKQTYTYSTGFTTVYAVHRLAKDMYRVVGWDGTHTRIKDIDMISQSELVRDSITSTMGLGIMRAGNIVQGVLNPMDTSDYFVVKANLDTARITMQTIDFGGNIPREYFGTSVFRQARQPENKIICVFCTIITSENGGRKRKYAVHLYDGDNLSLLETVDLETTEPQNLPLINIHQPNSFYAIGRLQLRVNAQPVKTIDYHFPDNYRDEYSGEAVVSTYLNFRTGYTYYDNGIKSGTNYQVFDLKTNEVVGTFPNGYLPFTVPLDSVTKNLIAFQVGSGELGVFNIQGELQYTVEIATPTLVAINGGRLSNNFLIYYGAGQAHDIFYIKRPIDFNVPVYQVVRKVGDVFEVDYTSKSPINIEASRGFPMVVCGENLFSTKVMQNTIPPVIFGTTTSGEGLIKNAVYANTDEFGELETTFMFSTAYGVEAGKLVASGLGQTLEVSETIFVPSGGRAIFVETSNFELPNQYVFAAVSGVTNYEFYQRGPMDDSIFMSHSNKFPQHHITKIRLDDKI